MKRWITIIAIFIASSLAAQTHTETLYRDIEGVEITASLKGEKGDAAPVSATILPMLKLEERGVTSVKEISALSPMPHASASRLKTHLAACRNLQEQNRKMMFQKVEINF